MEPSEKILRLTAKIHEIGTILDGEERDDVLFVISVLMQDVFKGQSEGFILNRIAHMATFIMKRTNPEVVEVSKTLN